MTAGESGVIAAAGRQWLWAARLLCDCAASLLQAAEAAEPHNPEALNKASTAASAAHMPHLAPHAAATEDELRSGAAWRVGRSIITVREAPVREAPVSGACLVPCSEAPAVFQAAWAALIAEGAAGGISHTPEEGQVLLRLAGSVALTSTVNVSTASELSQAASSSYQCQRLKTVMRDRCAAAGLAECAERRLEALTLAAVHAMARAARLLRLVYGQTHPLCEANMFAPFFSCLQAPLASAMVAAANATLDSGLIQPVERWTDRGVGT